MNNSFEISNICVLRSLDSICWKRASLFCTKVQLLHYCRAVEVQTPRKEEQVFVNDVKAVSSGYISANNAIFNVKPAFKTKGITYE